jgi:threonine dehydrogenase-like Zn-dependent dehydrogenase
VTVLGDGRLGLLVAQVVRAAGAQVRVLGRHANKLQLCERWGIPGRLADDVRPRKDQDVVIDCTGRSNGFELATKLVRPRGTIVLKTTVADNRPLNLAPLVIDEVTLIGSRCGPFGPALKLLAEKRVDVASLISRRFRLERGVEAIAHAGRPGVMKVLIDCG